ncbi:3-demethylubiquinone-9 3-methyltransferase [Mucilaginibacter frigoritolerans]|uniref:3-demethylubiquinone-9 3-methyltransferase n=2 Tax=Mucilaginibacter frigoritolerans TaxID=652788 RepID=A0A562UF09_9SPHI|nr:3-demethylubiquinone-9 3-methyltransferase [Mucilaginibacter frigoritolerans]
MFNGKAEEAMNFYVSLFSNAGIVSITHYGANEAGVKGTVMHATFKLQGQLFMCIDSSAQHSFTFTPAMSLYIGCESDREIDKLFSALSANGNILCL